MVDPKNAWCISEHWGRFGEVEVKIRSNLRSAVDIKVCNGCKLWIDVSFSEDICEGREAVFPCSWLVDIMSMSGQSTLISTCYVVGAISIDLSPNSTTCRNHLQWCWYLVILSREQGARELMEILHADVQIDAGLICN